MSEVVPAIVAVVTLGLSILTMLVSRRHILEALRRESHRALIKEIAQTRRRARSGVVDGSGRSVRRRPATPITGALVGLAVRRLPDTMVDAEKERWIEETAADLLAVGGPLRRLLFAFRLWRKGAPGLESAAEPTPRSAGD